MVYLGVAVDISHQQFAGFHSLFVGLIHDGRQAGGDKGGRVSIGETDDGNVIGDAQACRLDGIESSVGEDVVESQNGIRPFLPLQQVKCRLASHFKVYFAAHHQRSVYGDTVFAQCFQIAVFAAAHHVKMVGATDKCDSPCPLVYEVLGGFLCSHITVGYHLGKQLRQAGAGKEHEGYSHFVQFAEVAVVHCVLCQAGYDTLHVHVKEVVKQQRLPFMALVAVGAYHRVAGPGSIIFYAVENSSVIVGHQIGHNDPYHAGCLLAQTLCKRIGAII